MSDSPITTDEIDALLREAEGVLPEIPDVSFPPRRKRKKESVSTPVGVRDTCRQQLAQLGNIELEVRIELGRTTMRLEDVARLRKGSVVVLDRYVDEPVNVLVNGKAVARGRLIVVDGKFAVQLIEFL
ncbi:MAG: flagellar motor switch protein FliN [Planctomycetia bacterium]|nr:flagellar motor switch protein FliN [Planctomycetia bacterium]